MYTEYFGLKEKPFSISPDPRYLYMSEHHREALAHLLYGISSDGCLILLTGDVGTGKTTVCRSLLEQLPENTEVAIIVNPKLTARELLETICEELRIDVKKYSRSTKRYIDSINNHLLESHSRGVKTVVIIDEAQNLDMDVLEQLRLLTNLETDTAKLLKIVLIGQPELQERLESPKVSQINQRITSRYHLSPLSKNDATSFIQHRLIIAGGGRMQFFSARALDQVYTLSRGIPRLINVLCDRALLGAYVECEDQVSETIVKRAAKEVFGSNDWKEPGKILGQPAKIALAAVGLTCLGLLTFFWFFNDQNVPDNIMESAPIMESTGQQPSPEESEGDNQAASTPDETEEKRSEK